MSMVQQAVEVGAPLHAVYEQIAAFENYPRFMTGVQRVTRIGDNQTHWVMEVEGRRREFDAQITERSLNQRVSWATTEGPLLAETITLRPMGEARTQIVAQLEADVAFLLPSDRHGQQTLSRRLKADLNAFKGLIETGKLGDLHLPPASSKQLSGPSRTGPSRTGPSGAGADPASPASVAARAQGGRPRLGAGWGTSADDLRSTGPGPDGDTTPVLAVELDDALPPGRRFGGARPVSGGAAPMGGKAMGTRDGRGDGVINEEERGGDPGW
jgi:carbon monoxide dehydrogenase subunit G